MSKSKGSMTMTGDLFINMIGACLLTPGDETPRTSL